MADRRLFVEIEVEGNAVKVFKEIGQAAKTAAGDVVQSGERAKQGIERIEKAADAGESAVKELTVAQEKAAKAADEMAQHSEKAGKSLDRYRDSVKQAGAGLALLGTAFTMYANQARDHEITIMAIERIYGEMADSYVQMADRIQSTTIFSNDEALEAARLMGTLRENYDLTDQQIQQLIATSADLAAMHGFTLTDAAMRVQSAIRGEAESAEMLGLTMNQASIDAQGLTLTMSNAEAAAFRYDALMQQAASSTGFAADAAQDAAGKTRQIANEFQDAMVSVVNFTGPIGQAASGLTAFGAEAGLAVTGLAALAPVVGRAATAIRGLSLASMGPAGLVIGLGAVTVAAWKYFDSLGDNGIAGRMEAAATAGETLAASISRVSHEMSTATLGLDLFGDLNTLTGQALNDVQRLEELAEKWAEVAATGARPTGPVTVPGGDFDRASAEWDELIALIEKYGNVTGETLAEVNSAYNEIITNTLPGHEAALKTAMNIMDDFQAGHITLEELRDRLNGVIADLPNYAEQALEAAAANEAIASSAISAADSLATFASAQIAANAEFRQWLELHGLAQQYDQERSNAPAIGSEAQVQWLANYSQGLDLAALSALGFDASINAVIKTQPTFITSMGEGERAVVTFTQTLSDGKPEIEAMEAAYRELFTAVAEGAANLNANSVLGGGFSAIVGGAQGMGRIAQQTAEWAGSLAHASGEFTELDKLVLKGQISMTTYNRALDANHRIQQANNDVQEDVLRIQAKQLPIMAQMAEEQAAYVDSIADMPVAQQTAAMGFLDTAKASDAMALAQLAAASSTDAMQASTSAMILQMAEADPLLKAMLIDMKLLTDTDGVLTVNFGDVEDADKAINLLNSTLTTLTEVIAEAFGINVKLEDDGAEARLATILARLNAIDGRQVTAYVNTVGLSSGSLAATGTTVMPRLAPPIEMASRNIPRMATGGYVHLVGEAGPELVTLPAGAQVTNAAGTRGRLNPMGRSRSRGAGTQITNKGPVSMTVVVDSDPNALRRAGIQGQRR